MNCMKISALIVSAVITLNLILASPTLASIRNEVNIKSNGSGENTVRIENNTGSQNNTTQFKSSTKTNVEIHQDGEGTSTVKVNDKEWKLEGPGDISVTEESNSSSKPTATPIPSASPTVLPSPSASPNPSPSSIPEQIEEQIKSEFQEMIEVFKDLMNNLKDLF
jgi:hypothetical protein